VFERLRFFPRRVPTIFFGLPTTPVVQSGSRMPHEKPLRLVAFLCFLFLVVAGCRKNARVVQLPVEDVAKATPAQSATPVAEPINQKSEVIVLCYHRFEDRPKDSLAIKPADFEAQMQALKDKWIIVISIGDFLAWRRGEKSIPEKAAIISIDDEYLSGYKVACRS
jgi:hypothetical protein